MFIPTKRLSSFPGPPPGSQGTPVARVLTLTPLSGRASGTEFFRETLSPSSATLPEKCEKCPQTAGTRSPGLPEVRRRGSGGPIPVRSPARRHGKPRSVAASRSLDGRGGGGYSGFYPHWTFPLTGRILRGRAASGPLLYRLRSHPSLAHRRQVRRGPSILPERGRLLRRH